MKSQELWIKNGDKNTKYFQQYVSFRRNKKYLYEILDDWGQSNLGHEAIKTKSLRYLRCFYQELVDNKIVEQIEAIN